MVTERNERFFKILYFAFQSGAQKYGYWQNICCFILVLRAIIYIGMITVIQATNRPDSNSQFVSRHIGQWLSDHYEGETGNVTMVDLPADILSANPYDKDSLPDKLQAVQDRWMIPAEKFIWIIPEYNGSFPGVLKLYIDDLSVRKRDETFKLKKSMLIGIATGRSGNIRGMDHLTGILHHLNSVIYPRLLPISKVNELLDEGGRINHEPTLTVLDNHLQGFISF